MKATIVVLGDRSVGIQNGEAEFIINDFVFEDDVDREACRSGLTEFAKNYFDTNCYVIFDDECMDCGAKLVKNVCSRENCISKIF